jgi:hypothetical protein
VPHSRSDAEHTEPQGTVDPRRRIPRTDHLFALPEVAAATGKIINYT